MTELRRVVLGLDQGNKTGWGIAPERGRVVRHGLAKNVADRVAVVQLALEYVCGDASALFVMFEQHDHMPATRLTNADHTTQRKGPRQAAPERSNASLIGMGKNYGIWLGMLYVAGLHPSHALEVQPSTWRSRVHGTTRGDVKKAAVDWARAYLGEEPIDDNHAEGVALTVFASIDGLARYDAERMKTRIEGRAKRAAVKQGDLFGGGK